MANTPSGKTVVTTPSFDAWFESPRDVACAKGMSQPARDTGRAREGPYKALSAEGNPEFSTIMEVIRALGIRLHAEGGRTGVA